MPGVKNMAEMVTKLELENAKVDVKDLGEAVNEIKVVTPRYGAPFKSGPLASKEIEDKGNAAVAALNAKADEVVAKGFYTGYATETALKASLPTASEMRARADDTRKIWRWNRTSAEGVTPITGTWTDTGLSDKDLAAADATTKANAAEANANNYTDTQVPQEINKVAERNAEGIDLKQEVDVEGKIYARYGQDGGLYLTGMDGISVQEKLKSSPEYSGTVKADLASFEDPDGAIFLRIDSDSELHLVGQNGSVQENMALIAPKITNIRRDKRYFFIDEVQPYLSNLVASGMAFAPIPITLMPSKFTVPSSITNLKLTPPTGYIPLDSPYYKNDQVVHPYIFECIGTMRGYRYILSINPYTYEIHENPVIYGSNDLENFEMLTGFAQPLDTPPEGGFLSDTGFTYDPELGELICYWRVTRRPDDELVYTSYWCKRTKDLYTWTEKEQFFPELENGVDGLTSPAILFDPKTGLWHLWNIKQEGVVVHRTAPSLFGPWSASEVIAGASLTTPWHLEVKWCGDKMLMLINRSKSNSNYFLGISSDGTNWTFGASPMFDVQLDALYKATFIPNLDSSNNFYLDVFYTTNHTVDPDLKRRLFHVQTNTIAI